MASTSSLRTRLSHVQVTKFSIDDDLESEPTLEFLAVGRLMKLNLSCHDSQCVVTVRSLEKKLTAQMTGGNPDQMLQLRTNSVQDCATLHRTI
ncbi:hypothetical protein NPIL_232301 [Nephila pilipes]|uniref:Uncharacterized protein n=1 Tax=Nephila pilipes TaxID=299642 RepID=A0A8X6NDF1_NEPPI|nr:hypothetical protein NPIL_232301 [Nephila pilipes]